MPFLFNNDMPKTVIFEAEMVINRTIYYASILEII